MTPEPTSQPRTKSEAAARKNEEPKRAEAAQRDVAGATRVVPKPEDDKYFDVPCTD